MTDTVARALRKPLHLLRIAAAAAPAHAATCAATVADIEARIC
jgi:hypothetical protein